MDSVQIIINHTAVLKTVQTGPQCDTLLLISEDKNDKIFRLSYSQTYKGFFFQDISVLCKFSARIHVFLDIR